MPSMANITVKESDGTTDVVYNALSPSAGDSVSAQWAVAAASGVPSFRPRLTMASRFNGSRTARVVRVAMTYPITGVVSGVTVELAKVPVEMTVTLPNNVDAGEVKEAFYQFGNLVSSSLIRSSLEAGYAPT